MNYKINQMLDTYQGSAETDLKKRNPKDTTDAYTQSRIYFLKLVEPRVRETVQAVHNIECTPNYKGCITVFLKN